MTTKKSMIERAATLGLALWFAVLTIFVQGPHRHAETEYGMTAESTHSACTPYQSRVDANTSAEQLHSGKEAIRQEQGEPDHCSACLFLKNCKERSLTIISLIPDLIPIKQSALLQDVHIASLVTDSFCPRAPPASTAS